MILKFFLRALVSSGGIYAASSLVEGFTFSGNLFILAGIGLALAIFHTLIYPIIKIVAFPLVFLSFGLFGSIINLIVLWGIAQYIPELSIEGIMPLILGAAILSVTNILFAWL